MRSDRKRNVHWNGMFFITIILPFFLFGFYSMGLHSLSPFCLCGPFTLLFLMFDHFRKIHSTRFWFENYDYRVSRTSYAYGVRACMCFICLFVLLLQCIVLIASKCLMLANWFYQRISSNAKTIKQMCRVFFLNNLLAILPNVSSFQRPFSNNQKKSGFHEDRRWKINTLCE